jgi:hypothetical protein
MYQHNVMSVGLNDAKSDKLIEYNTIIKLTNIVVLGNS